MRWRWLCTRDFMHVKNNRDEMKVGPMDGGDDR